MVSLNETWKITETHRIKMMRHSKFITSNMFGMSLSVSSLKCLSDKFELSQWRHYEHYWDNMNHRS